MKDSQSASWRTKKKKRFFKRKKQNPKIILKDKSYLEKKPLKQRPKFILFLNKSENNILLFFIPVIFLLVFLTVYTFNKSLENDFNNDALSKTLSAQMVAYPQISGELLNPYLSAKAALAMDSSSQTILFSKNPDLRFSTASTAKIMTALVALDYYKKDSELSIKAYRTGGSGLDFAYGDTFHFDDLLYAMLLPSANDAAAAIADNYPGGRAAFVEKMNEKAKLFHLSDTHFVDSIGLDDDGNYSTVVDMARLASIAMRNNYFASVVGTQYKTISNISKSHVYELSNLNKLLGVNGVNGVKTGTTEGAGEVLVTSAVIKNHTIIIVTMDSEDRFGDTNNLLNSIMSDVTFVNPSSM